MGSLDIAGLVCELIAIPSVNAEGRVPTAARPGSAGMVEYVDRWLRDRKFPAQRQSVVNNQQNVIATLDGPPSGAVVVFDAHTDTVPADDWAERAFTPRRDSGRIYGRGSCDTKGSLAAMMLAFERASHLRDRPNTIVLVATADEELTRTGVRTYLADGPSVDFAVVGEPTCCEPVVACKGAARWDILTAGKSAHSSNPHEGVNAITRMADVIAALSECERTLLRQRTHPLVPGKTITPAIVSGGNAINVVPSSCRLSVDLRTLPGESPLQAMQEVQDFLARRCDSPLVHENVNLWNGADAPMDNPFVARCIELCRAASPTHQIEPKGVSYGCHASDYDSNGIPAVVIGPGDIAAAHAVDEFVPVEDLERVAEIYFNIMISPLTPHRAMRQL